jgi:hypothetical protein
MTKEASVGIAVGVAYVGTLLLTARAGKGDSTEPQHVALQTRQDIGSVYACLVITNALLAGILAALVF